MSPLDRLLARPERNVGTGDFAARLLASAVLAALIVMVLPQLGATFRTLKILLLSSAELGLVTLMLGLFLRTKTHFAGLQLFTTSLLMLWLAAHALLYPATAVGLLVLAAGIVNLVTRRSRVNRLLNLSSIREVIGKPAETDGRASPDGVTP